MTSTDPSASLPNPPIETDPPPLPMPTSAPHPLRRPMLAPAALAHSGVTIADYYKMYFQGALLPITAGIAIYGWRAAAVILTVMGSAALATVFWSRIGPRGRQLRYSHSLWLAMLLAMMLPAHLASMQVGNDGAPGPLLVAAGLMVVILLWLLGGLGASRIHPAAIAYLLIAALSMSWGMLEPHWVLDRGHLVVGDLLHGKVGVSRATHEQPWINRPISKEWDSEYSDPPAPALLDYTTGQRPARGWVQMAGLIRDGLPPLENLIIGGTPGPIGTASAVAVIIGGLFLLYRGVIDYRVPLFVVAAAFATFLIAPVPTQITDHPQWHWLAFRDPLMLATDVTLANYELVISPLLFTAFFLATSPVVRPMARRARVVYAIVLGVIAAVLQLYLSVGYGAYIALLLASLLTPTLDRIYRPRPLV